jgi:hypothetical protein
MWCVCNKQQFVAIVTFNYASWEFCNMLLPTWYCVCHGQGVSSPPLPILSGGAPCFPYLSLSTTQKLRTSATLLPCFYWLSSFSLLFSHRRKLLKSSELHCALCCWFFKINVFVFLAQTQKKFQTRSDLYFFNYFLNSILWQSGSSKGSLPTT